MKIKTQCKVYVDGVHTTLITEKAAVQCWIKLDLKKLQTIAHGKMNTK